MAKPKEIVFTMAALDADGISLSQTPGGAGNLTITGALATAGVATMDVARRVAFTFAGDDSARTFTITGTDRYGNAMTEAVTGGDTEVIESKRDFKTVSQIAVDAATAAALTVGTNGSASTQWIPLDYHLGDQRLSWSAKESAGAVLGFAIETTMEDLLRTSTPCEAEVHNTNTGGAGEIDYPVTGIRGLIQNFTSGTVTFRFIQSGISGAR
jgi:hypothetical protein